VDEAVDDGDGHGLIGEDLVPAAEGLVGCDRNAAVFVAPGDQLEEDARLGPILVGVGDVVEDDQVELVELGECRLEDKIAAGKLGRRGLYAAAVGTCRWVQRPRIHLPSVLGRVGDRAQPHLTVQPFLVIRVPSVPRVIERQHPPTAQSCGE